MNPTDELSSYYAELLEGSYDCVDRVVLNAYFPMGQTGGGLRTWWRQLHGSDANLNDEQLRDMAGTLSRRLRAYCARHQVPVIDAEAGQRKHELAEEHLPKDPKFRGLFLVITGNARVASASVRDGISAAAVVFAPDYGSEDDHQIRPHIFSRDCAGSTSPDSLAPAA